MKKRNRKLLFALAIPLTMACKDSSIGQGAGPVTKPYVYNWTAIADSSSAALNQQFYNVSGRYFNKNNNGSTDFNYWPQAHALDALVDTYVRTKDARIKSQMDDWFVGVPIKNGNTFLNQYYDDMLWNALAMLRAYDATSDKKWLDATQVLWDDTRLGWNEIMGGGIAWQKKQTYYKNTPANAPAIILAARLYQRLNRQTDLDWAKKIYDWQYKTLVDASTGLVYDGINGNNDGKLNTSWKFTYNQGLMIGAGLEMYHATKTTTYLDDAQKTANLALTDLTLSPNGIMRDEGNGDGGLFKAVLVRYLTLLATDPAISPDSKTRYVNYLTTNAQTLWRSGTQKPAVVYGPNWISRPTDGKTELTTQLSGTMLMEAMTRIK